MIPENRGLGKEEKEGSKGPRRAVLDAALDDLGAQAVLARAEGAGGPREAYIVAALVGFLVGQKRDRHSTGIAWAGGKRRIACEYLDLGA